MKDTDLLKCFKKILRADADAFGDNEIDLIQGVIGVIESMPHAPEHDDPDDLKKQMYYAICDSVEV